MTLLICSFVRLSHFFPFLPNEPIELQKYTNCMLTSLQDPSSLLSDHKLPLPKLLYYLITTYLSSLPNKSMEVKTSCDSYLNAKYIMDAILCIVFFVCCILCIACYALYYLHCFICIVLYELYYMHHILCITLCALCALYSMRNIICNVVL